MRWMAVIIDTTQLMMDVLRDIARDRIDCSSWTSPEVVRLDVTLYYM